MSLDLDKVNSELDKFENGQRSPKRNVDSNDNSIINIDDSQDDNEDDSLSATSLNYESDDYGIITMPVFDSHSDNDSELEFSPNKKLCLGLGGQTIDQNLEQIPNDQMFNVQKETEKEIQSQRQPGRITRRRQSERIRKLNLMESGSLDLPVEEEKENRPHVEQTASAAKNVQKKTAASISELLTNVPNTNTNNAKINYRKLNKTASTNIGTLKEKKKE